MIDVREAVRRAFEYFRALYADKIFPGLMLEEVELTEGYWFVTLGYDAPSSLPAALAGTTRREYTRLKIKAATGEILSMKIRRIE